MLKLKSFIAIGLLGLSINVFAADQQSSASTFPEVQLPKPVQNKVYDAMVGTWVAKDVEGMGKKMNDVMKVSWVLNHQFIMIDLTGTDTKNPKFKYKAIGFSGIDENGKAKTVWLDIWGAKGISTGSGEFGENSLTLTDSSPFFKETRTIEIKGKEMLMHAKGTKTIDGKEIPFDITAVYKKK